MPDESPKPPSHLSAESKRWWAHVMATYDLEPHHVLLLRAAAEAWDRKQQARRAIKKHGAIYADRFGQPRARPEVQTEKDCAVIFARMLRELQLDVEPPAESPRAGLGNDYA